MGIRSYFRGGRLARMSDGTRCIIRDLGLVKGGKGLRHFERLLTLTPKGFIVDLARLGWSFVQRRLERDRVVASFDPSS